MPVLDGFDFLPSGLIFRTDHFIKGAVQYVNKLTIPLVV